MQRVAVLGVRQSFLDGMAWLAGGADVSWGGPVRDLRFYVSLDWVLLDLLVHRAFHRVPLLWRFC